MNHLIVAPILLPAIVAAIALLAARLPLWWGRAASLGACIALLFVAILLVRQAQDGTVAAYAIGSWPAPFGIVLMLDRLSAMMLLLTAALALPVLAHAIATNLDRRGWHFHPLFQFLLAGLNGAFITGDLFNLFVFFEVLLIASYGLMLHGQGAARLAAGVQYVVVNLIGSTLFLIAVGILYGITGTLNMADLAVRAAALPPADQGLLRAAGLILTLVFALKAALLPLHLWLPRSYANAAPALAALFAILTKVGVYAILRVVPLIFGDGSGAAAWVPQPWMLPAALLTTAVGFVGVIGAVRLRTLAAYALIGSTGTLLIAVAQFRPAAVAAAIYYLPHSTLAGAALFLVCDLVARRRRGSRDAIAAGPRWAGREATAALYFLAAIAIAGLPPLSGFIGKLLILQASFEGGAWPWIWATILATTLIAMIGFARAGSLIFWKSSDAPGQSAPTAAGRDPGSALPAATLIVMLAGLSLFAAPISAYGAATARQLFERSAYIDAALGAGHAR